MKTTMLIKTEKELRDNARELAEELGVTLTTVVNSSLKQFVRERRLVLSEYLVPKASKQREWTKISKEMDEHPERYKISHGIDELLRDLKLK
ncbi:MAG: hypothetical protein COV07_03760 [Candidatus Vogelbacteria bacterium CG10_big_fil_rev_8_21_14_0_10_45_14]|uniref:Type II toxin-antitoxin system antitoxin, RelB/DinJ family n=1 Tax=Candidatus Vogelbacteria bacterium CG10_big_fil_rev_8_21_14_0_10_45_14 TaxID=1975042 RepID=A0A2H0RL53_9BACT|nr:MAG: hypothetical protein COV07_03760 [Candidatus Vogelbacteria bacterium CG10_big_fil_rev_8_21_14_0_10_45_14]